MFYKIIHFTVLGLGLVGGSVANFKGHQKAFGPWPDSMEFGSAHYSEGQPWPKSQIV